MDLSVCKAGKAYNSQAQEIVMNLEDFMTREGVSNKPVIPMKKVRKRVTAATGVSKMTLWRMKKRRSEGVLSTPGKVRHKTSTKTDLDSFIVDALRREIFDTYCRKEIPTSKRLLKFLQDEFDYTGSLSSVLRILKKMGFQWKRQNNRRILLERVDIAAARRSYLREVRKNRLSAQPWDVIFTDETFLHKTVTVSRTWQLKNPSSSEELLCSFKTPVGKGPRIIIVHAGGQNGWVEGAHLHWRSDNASSADYHGDMDAHKYIEWFENLCRLLENPTILVMDNASYHSTLLQKMPTASWKKDDIKSWLDSKGIEYRQSALRTELLCLAKSNPQKKVYLLDEMAHKHGHRILRLPPYHCELNPIELVWGQCKTYVRQNNKEFTLAGLEKLWKEAVDQVTKERWASTVNHVQKVEEDLWKKDGLVDTEMERFVINVGESSSSENETDSSDDSCNVDQDDGDLGVVRQLCL